MKGEKITLLMLIQFIFSSDSVKQNSSIILVMKFLKLKKAILVCYVLDNK